MGGLFLPSPLGNPPLSLSLKLGPRGALLALSAEQGQVFCPLTGQVDLRFIY